MVVKVSKERAEELKAVKEKQLLEARRNRKDTDDKHQSMLNRINFLQSEEAKYDREIENAKQRTRDLLARKAEKAQKNSDNDVLSAAKDILGALGPAVAPQKALRPVTGRSSLRSSTASALSSAAAALSTSQASLATTTTTPPTSTYGRRPASGTLQRLASSGLPLRPSLSGIPAPQAVKRTRSSPSSADATGRKAAVAAGAPATPPRLTPTSASRKATSPSPASPLPAASGAATPRRSSVSTPADSERAGSPDSNSMQQMPGPSSSADSDTRPSLGKQQKLVPGSGLNKMDALNNRKHDFDQDLIEELIGGCASAAGADQLRGLQQFSVESASKVVHVIAARRQECSSGGAAAAAAAAVLASGVGWGLAGGAGGETAPPALLSPSAFDKAESARVKQELAKRRQIRSVRKAFGLQPTPLHDPSAQLLEVGAGAWQ